MFRLDVGVRVNEGQRWEEQRVETANNPLPGPSVWSYWDLPPVCQVLTLSTSQRKQRALQVPSAFAHLHLCPSHLAGPLQNPLRSTPPYGRSLGLHFTSPPQSELGPLSCWLNWSSPQPSGSCLPEEEHLESFIWSSDELRGGGACLSPPSAHAPSCNPHTCPDFSLIRSSQYLVSLDCSSHPIPLPLPPSSILRPNAGISGSPSAFVPDHAYTHP